MDPAQKVRMLWLTEKGSFNWTWSLLAANGSISIFFNNFE